MWLISLFSYRYFHIFTEHKIDNYILSGSKDGMKRMDDSILALYNEDLITKENALSYAHNSADLSKKLTDF